MDGNNRRPRGDSNMQSYAPNNQSSSTPLRAAIARPENQEFNVAGHDFGGLPLDKAVKKGTKSGKKAPELVNEVHENVARHVDVPLKKPTQTVFSPLGGSRNASSTEIGWGGPEGGKHRNDPPGNFVYRDEDFLPPTSASDSSLSALSASKPKERAPSPSISAASDNKKSASTAEPHGTKNAPYLGLSHSLFRKEPTKKDNKPSANGTPEMNLGSLFQEDQSFSLPMKSSSCPLKSTLTRQDTPEMDLNNIFSEDQSTSYRKENVLSPLKSTLNRQDNPEMSLSIFFPEIAPIFSQYAPSYEHVNAAVHLLQAPGKQSVAGSGTPEMNLDKLFLEDQSPSQHKKPSSPLEHTPTRQDTPEMNLGSLFLENQSSSQPNKNASSSSKNTPIRQDTPEMNLNTLFPEDQSSSQSEKYTWSPLKSTLARQDTPEMGLDKLFAEDFSSGKVSIYAQNARSQDPLNTPAHLVHHSSKQSAAGRSTPEMNLGSLFSEDQSPSQPKKKPLSPLKNVPTHQDAPEMNLNNLFLEEQLHAQPRKDVSSPLKNTPTRQDAPEMNLNNLFLEEQLHARPRKDVTSPLKNTPTRQDIPEMNLVSLFNDLPAPTAQPLPGHAHSVPAHRSKKDSDKPDEDAQNDDPSDRHQHICHPRQPHRFVQQKKKASLPLKTTLAHQDTLEMSLDSLFPEEYSTSQPMKKTSSPSKATPTRQDTPEMNLNTLFPEYQSTFQLKKNALSPLKDIPARQDTSKMNLKKLFTEDTPASSVLVSHGIAQLALGDSTKPVSIPIADLLDDSGASDHSPYNSSAETNVKPFIHTQHYTHPGKTDVHAPESSAAGKTKFPTMPHLPAIASINLPFVDAKMAGMSTQPKLYAANTPGLPSNNSPWISVLDVPSGSAPSVSVPELPTLDSPSVSAPILPILDSPLVSAPVLPSLDSPSVSAPILPSLDSPSVSAPVLPSLSASTLPAVRIVELLSHSDRVHHTAAAPRVDGVRGMMPAMPSMSSFSHQTALYPEEEEADFPRKDAPRHENPAPSHVEHIVEIQRAPVKSHPIAIFRADIPSDEKMHGKRARKAQRKHDATRQHSIMDTISAALVGRKKNTVSSPVMRLNELFDEPMAMALPAPATHSGPLLGGIRSRLPAMPTMAAFSSVHLPSMPAMPAVPEVHLPALPEMDLPALPEMHLPSMPAMPILTMPHLPKLGSVAGSGVSGSAILVKHKPSTAATLKMPKIDPTLLPEEQANYPRGDVRRCENPAPSHAHVKDVVEVRKLRLPQASPSLSVLPPLDLSSLPKMSVAAVPFVSTATILPRHTPSTSAALKTPKVDLTLLPEEQANYPRGDARRHENPAPSHVEDIIEVGKLRLPPALPLMPALPILALDRQQKLGAVTAHRVSGPPMLPKHKPSKAAAIKMPKVDHTLLPEEQANYPRGDIPRHENPAPSHVEDIVEVSKVRVPTPLPLDAELPVVMTAAPAFSWSSIHMPTLPEIHMPTLPAMPAMPALHMPTLPKIVIPDIKWLVGEEDNYYSADDEPATPIVKRKTVVTEPARVIPKVAATAVLAAPIIAQRTTVVTEPVARAIPKVTEVVPVVTQKMIVTETTQVIPEVKKIPIAQPPVEVKKIPIAQPPVEAKRIPIAQPPVEVKKIPIAQPPVEAKKIPIAQPPVEVKKIPIVQPPVEVKKIPIAQPPVEVKRVPIAQPPVITKATTVKTVTTAAPAAPKIEVAKPAAVRETKEVKVMAAPRSEPNVHKPSATELYANEHRHTETIEPKVNDYKLAEKIAHDPMPVIPAVVETKKVVVETTTHDPKIVEAPRVMELHKVIEAPMVVKATASPAPIPAPRPEPIVTKTAVTTAMKTADPIPAPRPIVAAAAVAPIVHHHHLHKEVAPVQMETKHETTEATKTAVVAPIPQPVQQVKKVVEEVHHEPIPQTTQQVQTFKTDDEHHHQPQIQQQQTVHQQSVVATPAVETLFDSGERTMLIKKSYTTTEYYDFGDEDELDEFGHRKDRDVSLHIAPMPTAGTRQNFLQTYKNRKNSSTSEVAALQHQEVANGAGGSRRSSLGEPLKQQHPHFWERPKQVPQGANQQDYVTQIPLHDPRREQKQEYQVVQENVYSTQPRDQQQQQQTQHVQQQQQHQQYYNQNQPNYQSHQAYQQFQQQQQNMQQQQDIQMQHQEQPGVRIDGEYNRGPAQ
ncbi:hypothetical protein EC957_001037 [Mortierella hygrophila]|uniref:Uncharacterized protein n=1 Tax=Mortierella hygrophila TaxID=979708 RepID=A0A9P6F6M7_9FUNG|nr:hypothetical protein EC957_001037 [Mortierella hygrophila]